MHLFVSFFLLLIASPGGQSVDALENDHVKFEIRLASAAMKPGDSCEIVLYLTPDDGIHINTDPAMEFEFTKDAHVHLAGITALAKDEKTGYLNAKQPVKYSFTLDKKIPKGKHTLKGSVRYYYCSDAEGWCNRHVQPFELRYTVIR